MPLAGSSGLKDWQISYDYKGKSHTLKWDGRFGELEFTNGAIWCGDNSEIDIADSWSQIKLWSESLRQTLPEYLSSLVEPKGDGTKVIATIAGKDILAPEGGGGGDTKCLLYVVRGTTSQYVQWNDVDANGVQHTYKIGTGGNGNIELWKDGRAQLYAMYANDLMVKVAGNVFVYDDGYSIETVGVLDNEKISTNSNTIDTTNKSSMYINFDSCLEQSTPISMADGTTKAVCELKVGDKVLSLNPDTLQLEEDEVSDCDGGMLKMFNKLDVWNFADGTTIKTIKPH
jgi:hypothetical protein